MDLNFLIAKLLYVLRKCEKSHIIII